MGVWDISTPAGSDLLSGGDDRIRELKTALQDALRCDDTEGVESVFPGSAPSTAPVFRYRGLKDVTASRPAAGQYGLFFDTTRNVLQRDNGVSWDDVATVIPSGTKMVFYQASAPVGWTAVAVNDKFLRVVTAGGTGGSTGGTVAASTSLSHDHTHTHTTSGHVLTIGEMPSHTHGLTSSTSSSPASGSRSDYTTWAGAIFTMTDATLAAGSGGAHDHGSTGSNTSSSQLGVFAYADVVVASKD